MGSTQMNTNPLPSGTHIPEFPSYRRPSRHFSCNSPTRSTPLRTTRSRVTEPMLVDPFTSSLVVRLHTPLSKLGPGRILLVRPTHSAPPLKPRFHGPFSPVINADWPQCFRKPSKDFFISAFSFTTQKYSPTQHFPPGSHPPRTSFLSFPSCGRKASLFGRILTRRA